MTYDMRNLISHRGNLQGPRPSYENDPNCIDYAIKDAEVDCEIDVWHWGGTFYLGHDEPKYEVNISWIARRSDRLWIHAKNADAIYQLTYYDRIRDTPSLNWFWHTTDHMALTSMNYGWTVLREFLNPRTVLMCADESWKMHTPWSYYKICSDYIL